METEALEEISARFLNRAGFVIPNSYFRQQIITHPDYPSLLSLTETLDDMNITNAVVDVKNGKLNDLPLPFMAVMKNGNGTELLLVDNINTLQQEQFKNRWNKIGLFIDRADNFVLPSHYQIALNHHRKLRANLVLLIIGLAAFISLGMVSSTSLNSIIIIFSSILGVIISIIIKLQEHGKNGLTDIFCKISKQTDCKAVLNSKGATLPFQLTWSDIGFIYFSGTSLTIWISSLKSISSHAFHVLSFLSLFTIPFILFSIYYQKAIINKWCTLCLGVVLLLIIQFIFLFPYLTLSIIPTTLILVITACFGLSLSILLSINSFLKHYTNESTLNIQLNSLKRQPHVFNSLLEKENKVDMTAFEFDLQIGNPNANLQIAIACSPYCNPCAKLHKKIEEMLLDLKDNIGITIRFAVNPKNKDDQSTQVVRHIIKYGLENLECLENTSLNRELINDWFKHMSLDDFLIKYRLNKYTDVESIIGCHEQWFQNSNITFTPTVFINGYKLPSQYNIEDIRYLIQNSFKVQFKRTYLESMQV